MQSPHNTIFDRGAWLIGVLGTVAGVVATYLKWWDNATSDARVGLVALSAFTGLVTIGSIWQQARYSRKARYAEAVYYTRDAFAAINATLSMPDADRSQIYQTCQVALDQLAHIFLLVTSTHCRTCIKLLETPSEVAENEETRPRVFTLCRDRMTTDDMRRRQRNRQPEPPHFVDENTDFQTIYGDQPCFFENNLPRMRDYQNTSLPFYGGDPASRHFLIFGPWAFGRSWPFPYKSTIVVPILPARDADQQQTPTTEVGYLCIDSNARGVFQRRYDVPLLEAFSDALFPLLQRYHGLQNAANGEEGQT